jgi:hypothetical protein
MAIQNDAELASTCKALEILRKGLESLKREVMHPANYELFSEGWISEIDKLETEVIEYKLYSILKNKMETMFSIKCNKSNIKYFVQQAYYGVATANSFYSKEGRLTKYLEYYSSNLIVSDPIKIYDGIYTDDPPDYVRLQKRAKNISTYYKTVKENMKILV